MSAAQEAEAALAPQTALAAADASASPGQQALLAAAGPAAPADIRQKVDADAPALERPTAASPKS